jgi:hypothetical protein
MTLLSKVAQEWLKRQHRSMAHIKQDASASKMGGLILFGARLVAHHPVRRYSPNGVLLWNRGLRWQLVHLEAGCIYRECADGRASLTVMDRVLSATVCNALHKSGRPLATVVRLPINSIIHAGNPLIVSARMSRRSTIFKLRIDWRQLPYQRFRPSLSPTDLAAADLLVQVSEDSFVAPQSFWRGSKIRMAKRIADVRKAVAATLWPKPDDIDRLPWLEPVPRSLRSRLGVVLPRSLKVHWALRPVLVIFRRRREQDDRLPWLTSER